MKRSVRTAGFALVILTVVATGMAQHATVPITVHVQSETGRPVAGARIEVHTPDSDKAGLTDSQGDLRLRLMPNIWVGLKVQANDFEDFARERMLLGNGRGPYVVSLSASSTTSAGVPPLRPAKWEYGVLAQGGIGTEDRGDFKFFLLGGHVGKVLTPNLGSGLLQGDFEYAVEVFPLWQSYTPRFQKLSCTGAVPVGTGGNGCSAPYTVGGTYTGVSVTPIMLRWNLTHGSRWMPWLQGAGGVVWTDHKYPAIGNTNPADLASNGPSGDTSVWNFTPQFGIGTHYFLKARRSLDFSANAVHISSASLGDKNPGVNASVQFSVGYTWWK